VLLTARQDAQQQQVLVQSAQKTPSKFVGTFLVERLMQWCHARSDADLPEIYTTLANTKKGCIRVALQTVVEEALSNLHYVEDFPVSTRFPGFDQISRFVQHWR
jgi:tryptophanase